MKIICVGRNYRKHAEELGNQAPSEPVIFMKPDSAMLRAKDKMYIPDFSDDVHYEAELVVRIVRIGKRIQEKFSYKYYNQVTVGIDFTARDLQAKLKEKGLPWEKAKGFDGSAAIGEWIDIGDMDVKNLNFELKINGETVQRGTSADMLFSVDKLIEHISSYFTIKIGDLIYTGTPEGVGPVKRGDLLEGYLEGQRVLRTQIK
jgi:2-keto-4-pentenoate hydratase/2-oxohepta-3-ene-1,7-dioic acid hydratase in catechol pathway